QNGDQCATDLCDPQTLSCTESDCSGPEACASGICLEQVVDSGNGLCATACTLTGGCSGTDTCVIDTLGDGYCVPSGSGGHGKPCGTITDTSTGCVQNHVCAGPIDGDPACLQFCDYWVSGGCPRGEHTLGGFCAVADGDSA